MPAETLPLVADEAEHLARELARRVHAPRVVEEADPLDVEVLEGLGLLDVDRPRDVDEAGVLGELAFVVLGSSAENRRQRGGRACLVLDRVGSGVDGPSVDADRQRLTLAVIDRATSGRQHQFTHPLRLGLRRVRRGLNDLDPHEAGDDSQKQHREQNEDEREAAAPRRPSALLGRHVTSCSAPIART